MGWQKTFTLGKRAKGCHLITEEVLSYVEPGLRDVKASVQYLARCIGSRCDSSSFSQGGMLFLFM